MEFSHYFLLFIIKYPEPLEQKQKHGKNKN